MSSIQRQNRSSTLARQQTAGTRTSVGDAPVTQRVAQQNPAPTTQTPGPSHGSNAHLGQANQEASVRLQTPKPAFVLAYVHSLRCDDLRCTAKIKRAPQQKALADFHLDDDAIASFLKGEPTPFCLPALTGDETYGTVEPKKRRRSQRLHFSARREKRFSGVEQL